MMTKRVFTAILLAFTVFTLSACATVFRSGSQKVRVESEPQGAEVDRGGKTPTEVTASRSATTSITVKKEGYAPYYGSVKRSINPLWLVWDIGTCVFPITLCIPVVLDAITGAWFDLEEVHHVRLEPGTAAVASATPTGTGTPIGTSAPPPKIDMSDNDRKSAARAAYQDGVELQKAGKHGEALARFRTAQKLVEAPTHLLHIAQCLTATGKLLDAVETYETLVRLDLSSGGPEAFRTAQDAGRTELAAVKPRVPTLKLNVVPAHGSVPGLVIQLNGSPMPNDLLGLARPMNPGTYRITAAAPGYKSPAPIELDLRESVARSVDLKLEK